MELLDDPSHLSEQFVKRCNDWVARHRPVTWEDYIDGKADLSWRLKFTAFGSWYEARFRAQVVNGRFDVDGISRRLRDNREVEVCEGGGNDDGLVLVRYVGLVQTPKGGVASRVSLYLSADLFGLITSCMGPALDHALEVGSAVLGKGKVGSFGITVASRDIGRNANVQRASQVVDGIAENGTDFDWWHFVEGDLKSKLPVPKVRFLANAVVVSAQEVENEKVHLSNVRFRALQLQ